MAEMRFVLLPLLLVACAGSAGSSDGSSREPSDHTTYAPSLVEGENFKDGKPTDPDVAQCYADKKQQDSTIGNVIAGQESDVDTTEADFQWCWCKSKGYRGLKMDRSCK